MDCSDNNSHSPAEEAYSIVQQDDESFSKVTFLFVTGCIDILARATRKCDQRLASETVYLISISCFENKVFKQYTKGLSNRNDVAS